MAGRSTFLAAGGFVLAGLVLAGLGITLVMAQSSATVGLLRPDDREVVALGQDLYTTHCAACHGARLQGQPNWRMRNEDGLLPAPPHDATGHTWHHDDETLFILTKYGLAGLLENPPPSAMPVYDGVLSDAEIIAVLSFIKSTWPADLRAHQDALNARTD